MNRPIQMALIPDRLIFVWLGRDFPCYALVAIRSAARCHHSAEVMVLHDGLDLDRKHAQALAAEPRIRLEKLHTGWFDGLPGDGEAMARLYYRLASPVARSNLLRLTALWKEGGIYLDTDTITTRALGPLRTRRGFCGTEPVAVPGALMQIRNPVTWARAMLRHGVRYACCWSWAGLRLFRQLERFYPLVASNAVLGAVPRHPLLTLAFQEIAQMPHAQQTRPKALGVHLLQQLTGNRSGSDLEVLPPPVFYPLGPDVAIHWFRPGSANRLPALLSSQTRVVHWYRSTLVRLGRIEITASWIRRARHDVAYAQLAAPYID